MSYDFTPTYHIGMTAEGHYTGSAKKRKVRAYRRSIKPKQAAQHINNWLMHLENLMDQGDLNAEATLQDFYDRKQLSHFRLNTYGDPAANKT